MTASDPRVGEIQARNLIAFATECADPNWSLSIPPVAKGVIADLLAELRDRDEKLADVLAIADIGMNSKHGDPAFIQGWECAVEEVKARIGTSEKES